MYKFIFAFLLIFSLSSLGMAKNEEYYRAIVRILSYTDMSPSSQICVFNNPQITQGLQVFLKQHRSQYSAIAVNMANFKNTSCQAVYFSNLSSKEENRLIRSYPKQKILSISDNNPQCELGSVVCLSSRINRPIMIDVNMDSLARSQIRLNSQVLYMLKK